MGDLDTLDQIVIMGSANLALIQVQGVVVGALASVIAMLMAWVGDPDRVDMARGLVMCASSVVTASAASFILGIIMVIVIAGKISFSSSGKCTVNTLNIMLAEFSVKTKINVVGLIILKDQANHGL